MQCKLHKPDLGGILQWKNKRVIRMTRLHVPAAVAGGSCFVQRIEWQGVYENTIRLHGEYLPFPDR